MPHFDRILRPTASALFAQYPVLTLTGPRQSGKTTLCRLTFPDLPYANLEAPDVRAFAISDPRGFLRPFGKGAIIDEIQRAPDLTSYLQVLVDERSVPGQWVLTGSQQLEVSPQTSQSLAGRTAVLRLLPLSLEELVNRVDLPTDTTIFRGFLPRIYDADLDPVVALGSYVETYVERDIRQLTAIRDLSTFQRFVRLCAGRVGQLLNMQQLGNDCGVTHTTASNWMSLLEASYLAFRLPPYFANVSKRLVKTPKLYFYDVGIAAYLLGIRSAEQIATHPLRGALFENLVVIEALKYFWNRGRRPNMFFYRDGEGNEVDLVIELGSTHLAIEIKSAATLNAKFFGAHHKLRDAVPTGSIEPLLVYDGEFEGVRSETRVTTPRRLASVLGEYAG